jgi:hypothetical protein
MIERHSAEYFTVRGAHRNVPVADASTQSLNMDS